MTLTTGILVAKFQTIANAGSISHDMGDVILFIDTLEEVRLWADGEDGDILPTVRFRIDRYTGRLQK